MFDNKDISVKKESLEWLRIVLFVSVIFVAIAGVLYAVFISGRELEYREYTVDEYKFVTAGDVREVHLELTDGSSKIVDLSETPIIPIQKANIPKIPAGDISVKDTSIRSVSYGATSGKTPIKFMVLGMETGLPIKRIFTPYYSRILLVMENSTEAELLQGFVQDYQKEFKEGLTYSSQFEYKLFTEGLFEGRVE